MELKAYSKNDLLQKLAQNGFFVDYLTLDSFLEKYKIEAIFEDENGNEFFDISSFNILVKNVLNKNFDVKQDEKTGSGENSVENKDIHAEDVKTSCPDEVKSSDKKEINSQFPSKHAEGKPKESLLESIKWYRWDDISSDIASSQKDDEAVIVDKHQNMSSSTDLSQNESSIPVVSYQDLSKGSNLEENSNSNMSDNESLQKVSENTDLKNSCNESVGGVDEHTKSEINKIASSDDDNEADFDDIGLISESLQAQEKFQKYIADEFAKKNLNIMEPRRDNAFKFDVSEKTLNMIARTVAKKIAKQVSAILLGEKDNNAKLLEVQSKYRELESRANILEEQNKKLKLLLAESNKNLNSYRPTIFGLYRFVRRKTKKRN